MDIDIILCKSMVISYTLQQGCEDTKWIRLAQLGQITDFFIDQISVSHSVLTFDLKMSRNHSLNKT